MICPDSDLDCDNPGCRRGGCQGRRPRLPLFRPHTPSAAKSLPLLGAAMADGAVAVAATEHADEGVRRRRLVAV
jgi:hypothetical protein